MNSSPRLHLFEGFGIELEYMLVDKISLDVSPLADRVLQMAAGEITSDYESGSIAWSNELALHVIEIKTNGPTPNISQTAAPFVANIQRINQIAGEFGAQLMPAAMHPWMDPVRELRLWPHDYNPIYEAYNRIFDCRGHGWANLQSAHLNLPFGNDQEFGRLHAAIRLLLPILPALAASSPVADGHLTGFLDYRLEVYRKNSVKIPSLTGQVIPEPVYTEAEYGEQIFQKTYRDIAPFDPEGILQHPFLNSRGAIARFDRGAIEIRVLDVQECVSADLAICELISKVLQLYTSEILVDMRTLMGLSTNRLATLFLDVIRQGERAEIRDLEILNAFGHTQPATAAEIWQTLLDRVERNFGPTSLSTESRRIIRNILQVGPLARRIMRQLGGDSGLLPEIYQDLCGCLENNQMFGID